MALSVCDECGAEVSVTRLYRERMEYASYNGRERRATWTLRLVCVDCVDALARAHRGQLAPGAQGTLLG